MGFIKRLVSIDFETHLIGGDQGAFPRPVVLSVALQKQEAQLFTGIETMSKVVKRLINSEHILVGQNLAFDLLVAWKHLGVPLQSILDKHDRGEIRDTMVRELLLATESGELVRNPGFKTNLAELTMKYLKKDVSADKGPDAWRLRYSELDGIPLNDWPEAAVAYPKQDAEDTLSVSLKQGIGEVSADEGRQTRSNLDLMLIGSYSPVVDEKNTKAFLRSHQETVAKMRGKLMKVGLMRYNEKKGTYHLESKKLKQYVEADYLKQGLEVPRTDKGNVKADTETLLGCVTPLLQQWGEAQQSATIMKMFAPKLLENLGRQALPRYNVLVSTGRTSCTGMNYQQQSKQKGHRECFRTIDPEHVFVNMDFDSFEMFGLAQTVSEEFGANKLLDTLNEGQDPHAIVVTDLLGQSRDAEDFDAWRFSAKAFNFGGAGGMAAPTFIQSLLPAQREKLRELDPSRPLTEVIQQLLNGWKTLWELEPLFLKAKRQYGHATYVSPITYRVRSNFTYCSFLNYHFQPRCADAAKRAIRKCIDAHVDCPFGVLPSIFVHDEIVFQGPEDSLEQWIPKYQSAMVEGAIEILPDCNIKVGAEITGRFWSKKGQSLEQWRA